MQKQKKRAQSFPLLQLLQCNLGLPGLLVCWQASHRLLPLPATTLSGSGRNKNRMLQASVVVSYNWVQTIEFYHLVSGDSQSYLVKPRSVVVTSPMSCAIPASPPPPPSNPSAGCNQTIAAGGHQSLPNYSPKSTQLDCLLQAGKQSTIIPIFQKGQ